LDLREGSAAKRDTWTFPSVFGSTKESNSVVAAAPSLQPSAERYKAFGLALMARLKPCPSGSHQTHICGDTSKQQIPFGNDNQKSNNKNNSKGKNKNNDKSKDNDNQKNGQPL
jgi:hypothetical protein